MFFQKIVFLIVVDQFPGACADSKGEPLGYYTVNIKENEKLEMMDCLQRCVRAMQRSVEPRLVLTGCMWTPNWKKGQCRAFDGPVVKGNRGLGFERIVYEKTICMKVSDFTV